MNETPDTFRIVDLRQYVNDLAACRDLDDPDVMFPHPLYDPDGVIEAGDVCAGCTVRTHCLELARRRGEEHGVWGGRLFTPDGDHAIAPTDVAC